MAPPKFRITVPVSIGETQLVDSTIVEPYTGEQMFNIATEYVADNRVISPDDHLEYASKTGWRKVVTITNADPAVVTWVSHGFVNGQVMKLTNSGGALPTGLTAGTTYFVVSTGPDTFSLAATPAGTSIATTTAGSGVHTASASPNVGNALPVYPEEENDYWIVSGISNRHAPFDLFRDSKAISASPQVHTIAPGKRGNALGIFGCACDLIEVVGRSSGNVVYTNSKVMRRRQTSKWSEYFYGEFDLIRSFVMFDVPPFTNLQLEITITRATGLVECGAIVFGTSYDVGHALLGTQADLSRYSDVKTNKFGRTRIKPRPPVPVLRQSVVVPNNLLPRAYTLRTRLEGLPALWTCLEDGEDERFELTTMIAFAEEFKIGLDEQKRGVINLLLREF